MNYKYCKNDDGKWIEIAVYEVINFTTLLVYDDDGEKEYFRGCFNHGLVTRSNEYFWNGTVLL